MKKNIDIKKHCSQNWETMHPTQRGAFCESCALDVYDFTNNSGDEIRDILKLNLGSRVCGKINPSQLDELNTNFDVWQMNSKRSFQSALVFALIVAFGMTLFSCEEEDEQQKIGEIQQVGMSFMAKQGESTFQLGSRAEQLVVESVNILEPIQEISIAQATECFIVGEIVEERLQEQELPEKVYTSHMLGGMSLSTVYRESLIDDNIYDHSREELKIEFEAFTFPNPAKEQTTLRIMLPEKAKVQVDLFNLNGQLIQTISSKKLEKGANNLPIDLLDIPTGTYLISIRSEEFKESVRFVKL
jgi:hypothetical protein